MRRTGRWTTATVVAAMLLTACGSTPPITDGDVGGTALTAALEPGDAPAVAASVNAFGFDLLRELADGTENTITSPLSVAVLLAMILAGADGDTAEAMAGTLHLDDARDVRVGALLRQLTDTDEVTLEVANALWANLGTPFEQDYLDFVRQTFAATVEEADLGDPATADEIDAWVDRQTNGLIDGIAQDLGLPNPQAVLVLLNAVYFLGEWEIQFDPKATRDEPFTLVDGTQVDVPLMALRGETFPYVERDGYRMLRLPYGDGRFAMEVMLPDGDLADVLTRLDGPEWAAATEALMPAEVAAVELPRFELSWESDLNDALDALGMGIAFSGEADFRPMSPAAPWLDVVVHKTYIRVDEEGTEAAAVTGGSMVTSAPADPLLFRVDRPFAFSISDTETGAILFLGAITDPRG
jgi:serine protease inhibitor